jgi:hypothetical protein
MFLPLNTFKIVITSSYVNYFHNTPELRKYAISLYCMVFFKMDRLAFLVSHKFEDYFLEQNHLPCIYQISSLEFYQNHYQQESIRF